MPKTLLLYQGIAIKEDKVSYLWADVTNLTNSGDTLKDAETHIFTSQLLECMPGQLYEFESAIKNGTLVVHPSTAQYKGMWLNQNDLAKWQAADNANQRSVEILAVRKREGNYRWDLEGLRSFRDAYRTLVPSSRDVFLAQIITFITRPPKKK